jgi:hypothetical protein
VVACLWTPSGELVSFSDDGAVYLWGDSEADAPTKLADLPFSVTCAAWMPSSGGRPSETFVVGCSDGA